MTPLRQRREELHECFEVVDRALAGARVDQVFGVLDQIAFAQPRLRDPAERLEGKHVVGDPHLVRVGVAREGQQRGDLRLPSKPADAALSRGHVGDDGRPAADAVAIAIERILEREQRLVGDRFDQSRAEQRDRHPPRDHVDLRRHHRLAPVVRDREHLEQRGEADDVKLAVGVAVPGAHLRHRRHAADHRHVVTRRAPRAR